MEVNCEADTVIVWAIPTDDTGDRLVGRAVAWVYVGK